MHSTKFKLSVNGWKLLSVIEFVGPLSATEAAEYTSLDLDRVTRGVNDLVKAGLVVRREDPKDRRRVALSLSAKGKRVHKKIEHVSRMLELELLDELTTSEVGMLYSILEKLERRSMTVFKGRDAWIRICQRRSRGKSKTGANGSTRVTASRTKSASRRPELS
jgi:DNA-binding MarR family transcriptional regulator